MKIIDYRYICYIFFFKYLWLQKSFNHKYEHIKMKELADSNIRIDGSK